MLVIFLLSVFTLAACNPAPAVDSFKNQYCTDPRTMRRHAAYTEWADAYSCSRHRCQPGGRNLAIYTVGCKRVEAPESAIECEEVVEDTNMQFPYCCTRLRCLVVVRGEVWTRVLGQPWETLPAAPWSHMYKMKKPPPGDTSFLPKNPEQGPIYELSEKSETAGREKSLRASNVEPKETTECPDCNEISMRASDVPVPSPDIVIALTTSNDQKEEHTAELRSDRPDRSDRADRPDRPDGSDRPDRPDRSDRPDRPDRSDRRKRKKQKETTSIPSSSYYEEEKEKDVEFQELEEIMPIAPEKPIQQTSEEKMVINTVAQTPKTKLQGIHNRWSEDLEDMDGRKEDPPVVDVHEDHDEKREEKPSNLQALVDAIGTRMKDIENVVQRMSEKVTKTKPEDGSSADKSHQDDAPRKHHKSESKEHGHEEKKIKKYTGDSDYKRFTVKDRGSKYLRTSEFTTEGSLFLEEHNMNGYYQDASSTLLRRSGPKEPAQTYMAPVETRRQRPHESSETTDKKKKKHHKKKKSKHGHKKHHKEEKKKKFNKSVEEKNIVSLEDSNSAITK